MIKHFFKSAFRNLKKNRFLSVINILGLTIGLTICMLIQYYVAHEKSYDRFNARHDRIYRLRYERLDKEGSGVRFASCCPPAGIRIRQEFPDVEKVARIFRYKASVSYEENKYIEEKMFFAEPEFLEIFDFKLIEGNKEKLAEPNNAFISESTARKYFGSKNPIGLPISVDKKTDFKVAGVFEDVPQNSHVKFDILLSYKNLLNIYGQDIENSWGDSGWYTYLLLRPGVDPKAFESKLRPLVEREFGEVLRHYNLTLDLVLQPLTDIHLHSNYMQELEVNGNADTVKYLSLIAVLIMVLAWVNYTNLSTARSLTRAREVGLRKATGAQRSQLVIQFFLETILINIATVFLSLTLISVLLKPFSAFAGIPTDHQVFLRPWFWETIFILFVSGTVLSGIYPVFILTSFKPVDVLKTRFNKTLKGIETRKALVVTQFVMAIGLVAFTISIYKQLSFMRANDLGFSAEQKLVVKLPRVRQAGFASSVEAFRNKILSNPSVNKMCVGTEVPGKQIYWDAGAIKRVGSDDNRNYRILGVDYDYIDLFQLKLAAGRNFSKEFPSDSSALILNEKAVEWMGFKDAESALGKQIDYWGKIYNVIGVVKNYHQESVKQHYMPQIFRFLPYGRGVRGDFTFEINSANPQLTVAKIKNTYSEFFPNNPFEYFFLDEYYNQQYKADELFGKVIGLFSFLAIFITCLGILGLATFMVLQRVKEIGIRKVNGANISEILLLLNKEIIIWVLISIIIASPVAYYFMTIWLTNFASKTSLSWWIFALAGVLALGIALLTVSWQSWKAASRNPVEALRYE